MRRALMIAAVTACAALFGCQVETASLYDQQGPPAPEGYHGGTSQPKEGTAAGGAHLGGGAANQQPAQQ